MSNVVFNHALRNIVFPRPVAEHLAATRPDLHDLLAHNRSVPADKIDLTVLSAKAEQAVLARAPADVISRWCRTRRLKRAAGVDRVLQAARLSYDDQIALASKTLSDVRASELVRDLRLCDEARACAARRAELVPVCYFLNEDPDIDVDTAVDLMTRVRGMYGSHVFPVAPVLRRPTLVRRCIDSDVPALWGAATHLDLSADDADLLADKLVSEFVTQSRSSYQLETVTADVLDTPSLSAAARERLVSVVPDELVAEMATHGVPVTSTSVFAPECRMVDIADRDVVQAFAARAHEIGVRGRPTRTLALLANQHADVASALGALRGLDANNRSYALPFLRTAAAVFAGSPAAAPIAAALEESEEAASDMYSDRSGDRDDHPMVTERHVSPRMPTLEVSDPSSERHVHAWEAQLSAWDVSSSRHDQKLDQAISEVLYTAFGDGTEPKAVRAYDMFVNLLASSNDDMTVGKLVTAAIKMAS